MHIAFSALLRKSDLKCFFGGYFRGYINIQIRLILSIDHIDGIFVIDMDNHFCTDYRDVLIFLYGTDVGKPKRIFLLFADSGKRRSIRSLCFGNRCRECIVQTVVEDFLSQACCSECSIANYFFIEMPLGNLFQVYISFQVYLFDGKTLHLFGCVRSTECI